MPTGLHHQLKAAAREAGVSLNEHCVRTLSEGAAKEAPVSPVVEQAIRDCGNELVGVVLFGSYARGTAGPASDIDVLIVVDRSVTRSMYATWDGEPTRWHGHVVEPHFVRLPERDDAISSLWAEVAIEGALLYDPSLRIARHLTHIRTAIVNGLLVRHTAQGKPYWTAA